jgi:hypothetical protein
MVEVQSLMNRYYDASEKFQQAAKECGSLRPKQAKFLGPKPISYHPPVLKDVLVRDDSINSFVTEELPFSALVAPIEFDLYEAQPKSGFDPIEFFL